LVVTGASVFILTFLYILYQHTFCNYVIYNTVDDTTVFFDFFKIQSPSLFQLHFSLDGFGLILLNLAVLIGLVSLLALDSRFYWKNVKFIFLCHILIIAVFLFSISSDLISFFIFYEALLIPSFLLVYYVSPYRKAIQASLYFIIWTQLGSFLVLSGVVYIIYNTGLIYFAHLKSYSFSIKEIYLLYGLFFFGFGFKIPIWPFHH
jgi:NADH-quinone oxidoreductase subunit M